MKTPKISVIISTYNSEEWLEKVIWSYNIQNFKDFEMVIADDGSREETKNLIQLMSQLVTFPIIHIWQEDKGFQKSRILNKAILACHSDYILMSDGDCIAREDFVKTHFNNKKEGFFLSGGYFKLPMAISKTITPQDISTQKYFDINWLKTNGLKNSFKNNKLTATGLNKHILNTFTPTKASWNGHNSSGWKKDMLKINGFDELMQYGGQDREFGERLFNLGIKSKQIRYSAICLHLDHPRSYKNQISIDKNMAIRNHTKKTKKTYTKNGIDKLKTDSTSNKQTALSA